jgi:tetratricopeptide (TPR) repeat protein
MKKKETAKKKIRKDAKKTVVKTKSSASGRKTVKKTLKKPAVKKIAAKKAATKVSSKKSSASSSEKYNTDYYLDRAADLMDADDITGAAKVYLEGFAELDDWRFANEAGVCYQRLEQFSKAVKAFELALPLVPDRNFVLFNIGITYSMMEDYASARKALVEIWDDSLDPRAAFEIGFINMKEKKWQDALDIFDKAIFYDITLNGYNMTGSNGLDPELAARVFLNKARIFGFELGREEEARKMLDCLVDEVDDLNRVFTFAKEAVAHGKTDLAKKAAALLLPDYAYEEVKALCDSLGVAPE